MDFTIIKAEDVDFGLTINEHTKITIISRSEIDPLSTPDEGNTFNGFSDYGTYKENGGYRDMWTEKDWDFLYHLMMNKVTRKFNSKKMIILDDYREFRYLPKDWAENFCNELISRGLKHMVDFKVYHNDTARD
jgi:hypothetical protein